uniref:Uncharacterized protein n=1 Tax=Glossina pallidipes TaxID=7398 RepID=A0A1A9ZKG7_GLOPL
MNLRPVMSCSLPITTLQESKHKFEAYLTPKDNTTTFDFYKFDRIESSDDERVDELMTRLPLQAKTWEFRRLIDSILNDKLIVAIKSDAVRSKRLSNDITLEEPVQTCQVTEQAQKYTSVRCRFVANVGTVKSFYPYLIISNDSNPITEPIALCCITAKDGFPYGGYW